MLTLESADCYIVQEEFDRSMNETSVAEITKGNVNCDNQKVKKLLTFLGKNYFKETWDIQKNEFC